MTTQLRQVERTVATSSVPGGEALVRAVTQFWEAFDWRHSGFGDAPKFPRPSELLFLLREHARAGNADARDMVLRTLRAMALGGMRDHIGGGFHRYSVDAGLARAAFREDAVRPGAARPGVSSRRRRRPAIGSISRWPKTRCSTSCAR